MKISRHSQNSVFNDPGTWRCLYLNGDDSGQIRERAQQMVQKIIGKTDDPFLVARLQAETLEHLEEEDMSLSLMGGRRVIWLRETSETIVPVLEKLLKISGEPANLSFILIEDPGASPKSRLRKLCETAKNVAAIPCYPLEGRDLARMIAGIFAREKISVSPDAMGYLTAFLGSDQAVVRSEVEKCCLYAGAGGTISLLEMQEIVGDSASESFYDAVSLAFAGHAQEADRAMERALGEGGTAVAFCRIVLGQIRRLREVHLLERKGVPRTEGVERLRPRVFFKQRPAFIKALHHWDLARLEELGKATGRLEMDCKTTGLPDGLLAKRHLALIGAGDLDAFEQ